MIPPGAISILIGLVFVGLALVAVAEGEGSEPHTMLIAALGVVCIMAGLSHHFIG